MTFVLAMSIVAVFCAGLAKLWWTNRYMRKQEVLDEEKRARVREMRSTGLAPAKRANDIPFGVRAIQSGIEVDGIWISRPATPNDAPATKPASLVTLVGLDSDSQRKGKGIAEDPKHLLVPAVNDVDSTETTPTGTPSVSRISSQLKIQPARGPHVLNEDSLRRLEGQSQPTRAVFETYIPRNAPRDPRRPAQRSLSSLSGESVDSQPRSARSTSGRSYNSSRSSRLQMSTGNVHESHRFIIDGTPQAWSENEVRDPFGAPSAQTPGGSLPPTQSDASAYLPLPQDLPTPEPTFGPGDLHYNRASRRVNDGFEVLPAGTFGMPPSLNAEDAEDHGQGSKPTKRLRKKSVGQAP